MMGGFNVISSYNVILPLRHFSYFEYLTSDSNSADNNSTVILTLGVNKNVKYKIEPKM